MHAQFADARKISASVCQPVRAPSRILPSEAAAQSMRTDRGPWEAELTPELIEPLNMLASRECTGIVFTGPARTGKTGSLVLGAVTYVVTAAPGDMLIVQMSQDAARDFSRLDLDKMLRHSPDVLALLSPRPRDDNTYDKFFRNGMALKLGWPTVQQLSSKSFKYVIFTDYDRVKNRDDVDGEGPMFDLGQKRTETWLSRGKTVAESSPKLELDSATWKASTPHEAPPSRGGITSLYNRGTRARYYWHCQSCNEPFQVAPGLANFPLVPRLDELEKLVVGADLIDMAGEWARVVCPACGVLHEFHQRAAMKRSAQWVHEGQRMDAAGRITGTRRQTKTASYWLGPAAAAFQPWDSLLLKYLQAVSDMVRTGDEESLKFTVNTDQACWYVPRAVAKRRTAEQLMQRREDWERGQVPAGVRFLTAQVDVQSSRFVVEVRGWGVALETWLVDRFDISASRRPEGDRHAALDPAAYAEDWLLIRDEVMAKRYPLAADPSRTMGIHLTVCDSGGKAGVTTRAYDFYRELRRAHLHRGFALLKGSGRKDVPLFTETRPDQRADTAAGGRGDVPVYQLNVHSLKDAVVNEIAREEPGAGYSHFPTWLDAGYFAELTAEVRTADGWTKPAHVRNEAFDLYVYGRAACLILQAQRIDWNNPPAWAADPLKADAARGVDLAALAAELNG